MEQTLFEKLVAFQVVKKFLAFYGTRMFITTFIRAHHWSLSWASRIRYTSIYPVPLTSILILSFDMRRGLLSGLFPSGFPTKILYAFLIFRCVRYAPAVTCSYLYWSTWTVLHILQWTDAWIICLDTRLGKVIHVRNVGGTMTILAFPAFFAGPFMFPEM
jgi:hypothetical protein